MNVAVIGSGGREHTIAWALAKSSEIDNIYCIPGNGGTALMDKAKNIEPENASLDAIVEIIQKHKVKWAVIGPEDPLVKGLSNALSAIGVSVVGPQKKAAILEGSKDFSKDFMKKYAIACPDSESFSDIEKAKAYVKEKGAPIVIKADGLAAGKGVVVAHDEKTALEAIDSFMRDKTLGDAGNLLVIEEYLQGVEISVLAAVSVFEQTIENKTSCILPFIPARDHKRLLDGAQGPNTGGMGAIAPVDDISENDWQSFLENILEPTLRGIIAEKMHFQGFLFFGLMLTKDGPKLLEYNVRLGDPETQVVLPLMDFDFFSLCKAIVDGSLKDFPLKWKNAYACAPVMVSGGYPGSYQSGYEIDLSDFSVLKENKANEDIEVFIAGAKMQEGKLKTSGGRVLCVSAFGKNFDEARKKAYRSLEAIKFQNSFYRKDIGLPGAAESS